MKEREIREHATCSLCSKRIGHAGLPLFWKLTIERYFIDWNAMRRQDGLGAFLGNTALAAAMGPDEEMARPVHEPAIITVCEPCASENGLPVAVMAMLEVEKRKRDE